jgi:addiction module HigA family antidote
MSISIDKLHEMNFSDVVAKGAKPVELTTPGELMHSEFMEPHGLSANALARALHVPANRITAILRGQRAITADTAIRLGRFFGTTAEFWVNLQAHYDLQLAERENKRDIYAEIQPLRVA